MSNAKQHKVLHSKARHRADIMEVVRAGYQDAVQGLGYRAAYDALPSWQQRNYESGRLMATEFLATASKPAAWPASVRLPRRLEPIIQTVAQSFVRQPPHDTARA
jgi:hypothetical protein